jgi:hypothetical protein
VSRPRFTNPKWNDRLDAIALAEGNLEAAAVKLRFFRTLTNWHQLSPGAKKALVGLREDLLAALGNVDAALVEDTDG